MALERVKIIKGNNEELDEIEKTVSQVSTSIQIVATLSVCLVGLYVPIEILIPVSDGPLNHVYE